MKLTPVIAQDADTGRVLMLAWADAKALAATRRTGFMHYWSRSRKRLWKKGETSGHVQRVESIHYDCDRDTILARVRQTGPACHKGTATCFGDGFEPILRELERVFQRPRRGGYTESLLRDTERLRGKLLEEMTEFVMALKHGRGEVAEAADVIYHLLVALVGAKRSIRDVEAELTSRRRSRPSGRYSRSGGVRARAGRAPSARASARRGP